LEKFVGATLGLWQRSMIMVEAKTKYYKKENLKCQ